METLDDMIQSFLSVSYGSGDGDGDGSGDGYGYGSGDGYGYCSGDGYGSGYGSGDGYGDGYGYGSGYGDGIKEYNGRKVYLIDGVQTLIDSVHSNYAKGSILQSDLTLTPCYIAKHGNYFAHGDTLHQAIADAEKKALKKEPLEKRIDRFKVKYSNPDEKIPARELWNWHHVLTGSCEAGRNAFARDHGIDIDNDSFTVKEFINLTCNSYGSDKIRQLADAYGIMAHPKE